MNKALTEAPPQILHEMVYYKDGELYYTPEYRSKDKRRKPGPIGYVTDSGYKVVVFTVEGKKRHFYVHRLIYWLHTGEWPEVVDHIDRVTLNNHISNLRASTESENRQNRSCQSRSNTPFVGVHKTLNNGYRVTVNLDGKQYVINNYKTAETAALARDMLAHIFYGKFANLNILGNLVLNVQTPEIIAYPKESATPAIKELLKQQ
ncbi:HNH endonuclease [Salmonella enterica subsp. enterica serovar Newport]|nr:HNH endonuclease [Salmonella enterica subsp. enterica serovar Newport]